ncbi:hypothetical protein ACIQZO_08125 [Streptomyces sp. NPDC097617]|uniref:hypothetical protein n=1 Tax=Streptomyces sp. NPDC097617 TaxID=3366091 RepID=UPI00381A11C5
MADERNRWLDRAAAEKLLRGDPVEPVGPAADQRARTEAARLRAALDALGAVTEPLPVELPGEAAAVAAFRTAHGAADPSSVSAGSDAFLEPVLDLGRIVPAPGPAPAGRRGRTVSFGLAAALASVAVGGLAAAVGAGLLDRNGHDSAGPAPAISVSAGEDPVPGIGSGAPTSRPGPTPTPLSNGSNATVLPDPAQPPNPDGRTPPGTTAVGGTSSGTAATGGADKDAQGGQSGIGGKDGTRDTFGGGDAGKDGKDRDRELLLKAADLCEQFKSGRINDDRREWLSRQANGLTRIPAYCKSLQEDEGSGGGKRSDVPAVGGTLRAPTLSPSIQRGSIDLHVGR